MSSESESVGEPRVYAIRTTLGRELDVALVIAMRASEGSPGVLSVVIPPGMRGYVFIEARSLMDVYRVIKEIKYVKAARPARVSYEELERLLKPKVTIEELNEGDIVEIVRGPFRGMKARITSIDRNKNMLTVNILEASFTIPITIPGDYVKKAKGG